MRNGERPLTEEVIEELRKHRKVDGKREEKGSRKQRGDNVLEKNEVFDLEGAQKEAYKSKKKNKSKIAIKDSVVADTKLPKDDSAEINIKESVITGKTKSASGDKEEELALKVWLKKQKSLGRDTVATRFIEEEIKEEKIESVAAPVETKDEVKTEAESRTQTEESSATERPEEISTDDLERKKERIEELEKKEKELLEIFEQNKNKSWEDRTENINEITKVRIEKSEIKEEVESLVQKQPEDLESDYDIVKKRMPTDEEREKLNPLLIKTTNTAGVYIPEKFIEEEKPDSLLETETKQIKNDKEGFIKGAFEEALDIISEKDKKIIELEGKLKEKENAIKQEKDKLIAEGEAGKTTVEKVKKFVQKHPKVTAAIALGLIGGSYAALGGAPLYFVGKALLAKAGIGIWAPYMGGISSPGYLAAAGGIFGKSIMERIGVIKKEKDVKSAIRDVLANISGNTEAKIGEPQITEEKTKKPEGKKENFLDRFLRKIAVKKDLPDGELIKNQKPERMKKTVPETEDKFNKKAEDVRTFIGQLKEGKKTGKEIFEYLENLRHHFLYSSKVNFNSKIKPEFDKLSREEKTDTIDLTVEYFMSQEQHKGEFLRRPFIFDLDDIIYGKDFSEFDYVVSGKPKNVEWLQGNKS